MMGKTSVKRPIGQYRCAIPQCIARLSVFFVVLLFATKAWSQGPPNIQVFAGNDTIICASSELDLIGNGSFITGDVTDGMWFTLGDGVFAPTNTPSAVFSTTTAYIPGPIDIATGSCTLILVSDDPDGPGPLSEVSDLLYVVFQTSPPLVCFTNISLSLNIHCEQEGNVFAFVNNPIPPYTYYQFDFYDEDGLLIPDGVITAEHIGQQITYGVTYMCNGNSCWGTVLIEDKLPPHILCEDVTIDCNEAIEPINTTYPFDVDNVVDSDNDTYTVANIDSCGLTTVTYTDSIAAMPCSHPLQEMIFRTWRAEDEAGNVSTCVQKINVARISVLTIDLPPNYDDLLLPSLDCGGDWVALANGNPSPETTGYPGFGRCNYMQFTYEDINFDICGGGFKVLRDWLIVDWCTAESFHHNQIIQVKDSSGPEFDCPSDVTIGMQPYECLSTPVYVPIPSATYDCSAWSSDVVVTNSVTGLPHDDVVLNGDQLLVNNLPEGIHIVTYTLTDECDNTNYCTSTITVIDDVPPIAVCDEHTTLSLISDGTARLYAASLDDGSLDNCQIEFMEVAKMTDACGFGTDFGPFADFCCLEAGAIVMVQFRVTDAAGHSNTCMVEVRIDEKEPPTIVCLPDLSVHCDFYYDADDLSVFGSMHDDINDVEDIIIYDGLNDGIVGQDGYIDDNCGASFTEEATFDIECDQGTIRRRFIVTDMYGQVDSCVQYIHFVNPYPIGYKDIIWPEDFDSEGCDNLVDAVEITGEPTFLNDHCSSLAVSYKDEIFDIIEGACTKIIREWTVIDWCQFDGSFQVGYWQEEQIIKLFNSEAPVFTNGCQDTVLCIYSDDCLETFVLSESAYDDCTSGNELQWRWQIDLNDDGIYDAFGNGHSFAQSLAPGHYAVEWHVEDRCGNANTCVKYYTVEDCKTPSPYCISDLTTVVMEVVGEVTIWASDFDLGSSDNCTNAEDLIFSFSADTADRYLTIDCDQLQNGIAQTFPVEMWVTDEAGNQNFCHVMATIQDNNDNCPDDPDGGFIDGMIQTPSDESLPGTDVKIQSSLAEFGGQAVTDANGFYRLDNIPQHLYYHVTAQHEEISAVSGVTTLDMLMIQRHILDLAPFDDPYQVIAADIDGSHSVSAIDLVQLRKVILGLVDTFPNSPSIRFVDGDQTFALADEPWDYREFVEFMPMNAVDHTADFVGVKIGDVNESFEWQSGQTQAEFRSASPIKLRVVREESDDVGVQLVRVETMGNTTIQGLQFGLHWMMDDVDILEVAVNADHFSEEHCALNTFDRSFVAFSWHEIDNTYLAAGTTLLELRVASNASATALTNELHLDDRFIRGEGYVSGEVVGLTLTNEASTLVSSAFQIDHIDPNPFSSEARIEYTSNRADALTLEIRDITGQVIVRRELQAQKGKNQMILRSQDLNVEGLIYVFLTNGRERQVRKAVHMKGQ